VLAGSAKEHAKLAYGQAVRRPDTLGPKLQTLDHATRCISCCLNGKFCFERDIATVKKCVRVRHSSGAGRFK
jgi:hypothetical protein